MGLGCQHCLLTMLVVSHRLPFSLHYSHMLSLRIFKFIYRCIQTLLYTTYISVKGSKPSKVNKEEKCLCNIIIIEMM